MPESRAEHLAWCKKRALEVLETGDISGALTSMISDMREHEETASHPALQLGLMLSMGGHLCNKAKMKKFIEDFN